MGGFFLLECGRCASSVEFFFFFCLFAGTWDRVGVGVGVGFMFDDAFSAVLG